MGSCACPSQGDIVSDILKAEIQPPDLCCCQIRIVLCGQAGRQSWGNGETLRWRQVPLRLPAAPEQGEPGGKAARYYWLLSLSPTQTWGDLG